MLELNEATPAVLVYMHHLYEHRGESPIDVTIAALLRSVRRKRQLARKARAAAQAPPPQPPPADDAELQPTPDELAAVGFARQVARGMRETVGAVAAESLAQGFMPVRDAVPAPAPPATPLTAPPVVTDEMRQRSAAARKATGAPDDPMESLVFLAELLTAEGRDAEARDILELVAWRLQRPQGP